MNDNISQENFWNKLGQKKFDLFYYAEYFKRCVFLCRLLKSIVSIGTVIITAIFMNWFNIELVKKLCLIVVIILQGVNAFSECFPFEKRKSEIFNIEKEISSIYIEMEKDWIRIKKGKINEDEIDRLLLEYAKRYEEVDNHFFNDDALPYNHKIEVKAKQETDKYMNNL